MREKALKPCFTIRHTYRDLPGVSHYGAFERRRDAERWLEDNPNTPNAKIVPSHAHSVCNWDADCPKCKTRAIRDRVNQHKPEHDGDTRLSWMCPACNHQFAD